MRPKTQSDLIECHIRGREHPALGRVADLVVAQAAVIERVRRLTDAAESWNTGVDTDALREALSPAPAQCRCTNTEAFLRGGNTGCPRDGDCPEHGKNRPGQCVTAQPDSVIDRLSPALTQAVSCVAPAHLSSCVGGQCAWCKRAPAPEPRRVYGGEGMPDVELEEPRS